MKFRLVYLLIVFTVFQTSAQVGVNTETPESNLDVRTVDPNVPTAMAGIAIPQVAVLPSTGNRIGQIVMNTSDQFYYYYNGTAWVQISYQVHRIGDVKQGFQTADHDGWVLLEGQDITTLTANQKINASSLGFVDFLPDARERVLSSRTVGAPGSIGGNNTISLLQNNLPNVILNGTTSVDGDHRHPIRTRQDDWSVSGGPASGRPSYGTDNGVLGVNNHTDFEGGHSHTVDIPLGGSGVPIDITPQFLQVNTFIFLQE